MQFSPWGGIQHQEVLADGIVAVSTASHGGIVLSAKRQRQLNYKGKNFLNDNEFWEEDCDWAIPFVFFADEIKPSQDPEQFEITLKAAKETIKQYHPEFVIPA